MAKAQAQRTHCPQGHPYDEANTLQSGGKRRCKTCTYARWRDAHPRSTVDRTLAERFWPKFVKVDSGCWQWTAGLDPHGYGMFSVGGGNRGAHHVAWELFVGPVPVGLTIDHLCRNHSCVNPSHMEPVTRIENVMRGESPPARNARKTHCPSGHEYSPENIYVMPSTGWRRCRACIEARKAK